MSAKIIPFHTRPLAPLRFDPDRRYPPGPSLAGALLVSIGLWWITAWYIWFR